MCTPQKTVSPVESGPVFVLGEKTLSSAVDVFERGIIEKALGKVEGVQTKAAELLAQRGAS